MRRVAWYGFSPSNFKLIGMNIAQWDKKQSDTFIGADAEATKKNIAAY
jgi:hypothetical protein